MDTRRTPSALPAVLLIVAVIVVVTVGIFYLAASSSSSARKAKVAEKKAQQAAELAAKEFAKTHPPAPVNTSGSGKRRTMYVFPPDGCITKFLQGDWGDYPMGGKITFTDSTGKVVFEDGPGILTASKLPAGNYKICKKDPGAWGVEIWE